MERVLITGASGFIGQHLCRYLTSRGYHVIACTTSPERVPQDANLTTCAMHLPDSALQGVLRVQRPAWVIHCAGSASVPESFRNPGDDFQKNVVVTEALFAAIAAHSPDTRVIFLSSAAVYGNPAQLPIDEQTPTDPISPYGFHKLMCEWICRKYARTASVCSVILRVFSAYGPGLTRQILWDIYRQSCITSPIRLHGTGSETRDFIYIDDVVKSVHLSMQYGNRSDCQLFNVASGTSVTIERLVHLMLAALRRSPSVAFINNPRRGDPLRWEVDVHRLRELGLTSCVPLEQGIRNYLAWLSAQESE